MEQTHRTPHSKQGLAFVEWEGTFFVNIFQCYHEFCDSFNSTEFYSIRDLLFIPFVFHESFFSPPNQPTGNTQPCWHYRRRPPNYLTSCMSYCCILSSCAETFFPNSSHLLIFAYTIISKINYSAKKQDQIHKHSIVWNNFRASGETLRQLVQEIGQQRQFVVSQKPFPE